MSDYSSPYSYPTATSPDGAGSDVSGRHPVNVGHLVMGVAFLGLAAIWALFQTDAIGRDDLQWFLPLPWLAAGLAGLLAVALTSRRPRPEYAEAPASATPEPLWAEHDETGALRKDESEDGTERI